MSVIDSIIAEVTKEAESTKRILSRVPADKFDWQPHEKSTSLKKLATHIASLNEMVGKIISCESFYDISERVIPEINNTEDLVAFAKRGKEYTIAALKKANDAELAKPFELRAKSHVIMSLPKGVAIRAMGLSHIYHHRGQLSVYLRLLDVPVPGMYGPSADDKAHA